jgi:hypothetical protein
MNGPLPPPRAISGAFVLVGISAESSAGSSDFSNFIRAFSSFEAAATEAFCCESRRRSRDLECLLCFDL